MITNVYKIFLTEIQYIFINFSVGLNVQLSI